MKRVSKWLGGLAAAVLAFAAIVWFHAPLATWLYVITLGLSREVPPVRIVDNVYYGGASALASFLVTGTWAMY